MPPTVWERVKTGSKSGFDKTWQALDKIGAPVNKLSNKLGSEAFWPTTLDKECDKAARILRSFCKDGFYGEEDVQLADGPKMKQKVLQKIPEKVIRKAKGLAIFTTMRTGLWMSGSGGSGVLIARLPDGSWSCPSGILMHTAGLGFMVGIDIYDCVIVINNEKALEAFTKVRCTLGAEVSVAAGPVGAGGVLDTEVHRRQAAIYTYLKSRGFYAGVQIDGTIVLERTDENERFYHQKLPVKDILAGKVRHPPPELKMLMETLKAAQGDNDFDASMLPTEAPPGDFEIDTGETFGVPDKADPDPYGVLALEKEGMSLKEAGTSKRASWEQFTFQPSPTSPVHSFYARQGHDARSTSRRNSWRTSALSNEPKTPSSLRNSIDRTPAVMMDSATQTDFAADGPPSPARKSVRSGLSSHSSRGSLSNNHHAYMQDVPEHEILDSPAERKDAVETTRDNGYTTPPHTPPAVAEIEHEPAEAQHDEDDARLIEPPIVQSFQKAQPASAQVLSRARLVNVPKRVAPKLPPRNPNRTGAVAADSSPRSPSSPADFADREIFPSTDVDSGDPDSNTVDHLEDKMHDIELQDDKTVPPSDTAPKEHSYAHEGSDETKMPGGFD